jgi:hypothetical protein
MEILIQAKEYWFFKYYISNNSNIYLDNQISNMGLHLLYFQIIFSFTDLLFSKLFKQNLIFLLITN